MTVRTKEQLDRKAYFAEVDTIQLVREALANIRFGAIQLTVHEGRLVQMEVTEKRRFI